MFVLKKKMEAEISKIKKECQEKITETFWEARAMIFKNEKHSKIIKTMCKLQDKLVKCYINQFNTFEIGQFIRECLKEVLSYLNRGIDWVELEDQVILPKCEFTRGHRNMAKTKIRDYIYNKSKVELDFLEIPMNIKERANLSKNLYFVRDYQNRYEYITNKNGKWYVLEYNVDSDEYSELHDLIEALY